MASRHDDRAEPARTSWHPDVARLRHRAPWVIIGLYSILQAWILRAEASPPSNYANDMSVHRAMVRWAADRIAAGHLPFDGWFPDVSLGSAHFSQYQSTPHVIGGALATL